MSATRISPKNGRIWLRTRSRLLSRVAGFQRRARRRMNSSAKSSIQGPVARSMAEASILARALATCLGGGHDHRGADRDIGGAELTGDADEDRPGAVRRDPEPEGG